MAMSATMPITEMSRAQLSQEGTSRTKPVPSIMLIMRITIM